MKPLLATLLAAGGAMHRGCLPVLFGVVLLSCGGDDDPSASHAGGASPGAAAPGAGSLEGTPGTSNATGSNGVPTAGSTNGYSYAFTAAPATFDCNESLDAISAKQPAKVTFGASTIVVGYEQVGGNDQDPLVARFDNGQKVFCEHSKKGGGIDGRAYGLTWDGGTHLYVVYTIVGGGTLFDTAAKGGWLSSYGDGGASAKASVIGIVDTTTGVVTKASFVTSKLTKNGQLKTNTLVPADAVHVTPEGAVEFFGTPAYCTLNPDRSSMCDPNKSDYPKDYRARFNADLTEMLCASASGVSLVKQACP